jgi:hypothetical protein
MSNLHRRITVAGFPAFNCDRANAFLHSRLNTWRAPNGCPWRMGWGEYHVSFVREVVGCGGLSQQGWRIDCVGRAKRHLAWEMVICSLYGAPKFS